VIYQPVQAGFSSEPVSGTAPLNVAFTNLSSGDYTASRWDFGDGITFTLANPTGAEATLPFKRPGTKSPNDLPNFIQSKRYL